MAERPAATSAPGSAAGDRRIWAGIGGESAWIECDRDDAAEEIARWFAEYDREPAGPVGEGIRAALGGPHPRIALYRHGQPCDPAHIFAGPEWKRFVPISHPTRRLYSDTAFGGEPALEIVETQLVVLRRELWPLYLQLAHGWLLLQRKSLVGLHAAVAAARGTGIVLVGASGSGKSTLSLALMEEGADCFGDEWAFFRLRDLGLLPWPRPLHLRPGGLEALGSSRHSPEWYEAKPGDPKCLIATAPTAPCPAHQVAFYFLDGFAQNASLAKVSGAEAARRLQQRMIYAEPRAFERLAVAADLVSRYPCWSVQVGKPALTAKLLIEHLRRAA